MEFEKEHLNHFPWLIDTFLPTQKQFWCRSSSKCYVVIRMKFTMNDYSYKKFKRWQAFETM